MLVLSQVIKSSTPPYKGMPQSIPAKIVYVTDLLETLLLPHFRREETQLFDVIKGKHPDIDRMIDELTEEHVSIANQIRELETARDQEGLLNNIGVELGLHIRMEERLLFELIQAVLPEEEMRALEL